MTRAVSLCDVRSLVVPRTLAVISVFRYRFGNLGCKLSIFSRLEFVSASSSTEVVVVLHSNSSFPVDRLKQEMLTLEHGFAFESALQRD